MLFSFCVMSFKNKLFTIHDKITFDTKFWELVTSLHNSHKKSLCIQYCNITIVILLFECTVNLHHRYNYTDEEQLGNNQ